MKCLAHLCLLTLLTMSAAPACSDPDAPAPPPRTLSRAQRALVARHLLATPPAPSWPASVAMGDGALRYLGTSLSRADGSALVAAAASPPTVRRGERVRVAHYFEALGPIGESWKVFLHVSAPGLRRNLVNADHFPVGGLWSTQRWQPGQIVEDVHELVIPDSAPDRITGWLGLYRLDRRLKVDARADHDGQNRLRAFELAVTGTPRDLPVYRARRRSGPIAIDGRLDDEGWQGVAWTGPFRRTLDGKRPRYATRARLTWDDEALYVAFEVEDPDVWGTLTERDAPIYGEEVVEVFIDADGDGRTYNELELSPRGVQFDAYFPARRQGVDLGWDAGMTSAVRVRGTLNDPSDRDEGWDAELRIPVANLASVPRWPPQPGDRWRFNLYRLEWHSQRKRNEGSAFSPPFVGDFHHLPRFGWLEFE